MGSPFHDATLVDDQNLIRVGDRRETVGDDEARLGVAGASQVIEDTV